MDGFKNTTKTSYDTASGRKFANGGMTVSRADMPGGEGPMNKPAMVAKYAKGGHVKKGEQKIGRVMKEFTEGKLHSGSKEGPKVKSTKQAVAIALNEARAAGAKIPRVKRNEGTPIGKGPEAGRNAAMMEARRKAGMNTPEAADVLMARMTKDELAQGERGVRMAQERLERKTVRRGVPPTSKAPLISQRMQEVGKSIGVRKASGGLTLSNVPQSARLTLSNAPSTAPAKGLTLSNVPTTPAARPAATPQPAARSDPGFNANTAMNTFNQQLGARVKSGQMSVADAQKAQAEMRGLQLNPATANRAAATQIAQRNLQVGQYAPASRGMKNGGLSVMPKGKKGC